MRKALFALKIYIYKYCPYSPLESLNFKNAINEIKSNLSNSKPVVIGVHRSDKFDIYNDLVKATHHFVVIVGFCSGVDADYFLFHEVGTKNDNRGDAFISQNKLKINYQSKFITGRKPYGNGYVIYTLTEIYKNDK